MSGPLQPPEPPARVSFSELVPLGSRKIRIWRSRALLPLLATAVTCLVLFAIKTTSKEGIYLYMAVFATFAVFMMFAALYDYSGERKNMLWYLWPALITELQLLLLLKQYSYVFVTLLPGAYPAPPDFPGAFKALFFVAGLREELLKAVPILFGLVIALRLRRTGSRGSFLARGLAVEGPVDGLLMGAAAGAAFILDETLADYVPRLVASVLKQSQGDEGLAYLYGMILLLPRVLNGIIGHMAYAGIFGYFIGLAVSHPRDTPKLIATGWLVAALLHTLWDSLEKLMGSAAYWVVGLLSLVVFLACLLKGKQLEVSRLGGPIDGRSILAVSPQPGAFPAVPAGIVPPPAPGLAGAFTSITTKLERAIGVVATTTVPRPGSQADLPQARKVAIGTDTVRYALEADRQLDLASLFAAAGVPPGSAGSIAASGAGGFEITNTGAGTWTVALPDGHAVAIPPGDTFRAVAGTAIGIGPATLVLDAY